MTKQKNGIIIAAVAIIAIAVIAGIIGLGIGVPATTVADHTGAAAASPEKTLKIGYLPTNGHALQFIAQEQGYFEEQGLNVELFQFQNSAEGSNAIIAKKIDVGGFGPSPLVYAAKGSPVTIIGGLMAEGAGVIVLPEKADQFPNPASFAGKTVATVRMSSGDIHFRGALRSAGLDLQKDITIQEISSPAAVLDAVKAGKVDAGIVWTPFMEMAESQGLTVIAYTSEYYPKHPCCRIATLTENLETDRDTYVRMEKALIQAYRYSRTDPDGAVDDVIKYVKIDRDVLKDAMQNTNFYISPDPNLHGIVQTYDLLKSIGYIDTDIRIQDHVDTSVYKQALDELASGNPDDPVYRQLLEDYKEMDE
ncbi:MAG: ABC transporter substrate-binding protein [Methanoculleus sp.]|jgi:NitT/TauT family transport system substrate-binding protein|uniref:ABC transporter substrate-binding protein n=1 Tax=Methanoculleus sp. TaxID=90427 RepID=UPI0026272D2F|nr:ABC transporter substrate-binding protein [Methanoculleus sp.]MCK9305934.1 ABC transporter substrate-binding protein [Methanoculleus sp.]MDD2254309.1 ABC transporter substrate-binding protein [Methanoculleus sp.]MDD4314779.1 ABC transporter substrate-binding protein [Methanoculleus sp.]MDD4471155.1 ABC transporter substrate-binding protein [Methanoculleus sp.]